jgi:hypothetical protein
MIISIYKITGDFGEDKDAAAMIRKDKMRPVLKDGGEIILDFEGVDLVTQSFIHALISDILRTDGVGVLRHIEFKNCATVVRGIISTVVQYSLETAADSK